MKIVSIEQLTSHIVTTDDPYANKYRRNGADDWESCIGESCEAVCGDLKEELERLFQKAQIKSDPVRLLALIEKIRDENYGDEQSALAISRLIRAEIGDGTAT